VFGQQEGVSIIGALEHCPSPRPIPHDLLATFVEKLGGTIRHVVVTKLHEEQKTFYATIALESSGSIYEIDARPSDALALAVIQDIPIFVEEALLEWIEKDDPSWAERDRLATVW
jgi:bifunctional DNase/RNase